MTYVVTENCIKCKYTDCVKYCPTDCFHEGEDMLVINPAACIDCGVCQIECPANAIRPDTDAGMEIWVEHNHKYSQSWPLITQQKAPPADADKWLNVEGKFKKFYG